MTRRFIVQASILVYAESKEKAEVTIRDVFLTMGYGKDVKAKPLIFDIEHVQEILNPAPDTDESKALGEVSPLGQEQ